VGAGAAGSKRTQGRPSFPRTTWGAEFKWRLGQSSIAAADKVPPLYAMAVEDKVEMVEAVVGRVATYPNRRVDHHPYFKWGAEGHTAIEVALRDDSMEGVRKGRRSERMILALLRDEELDGTPGLAYLHWFLHWRNTELAAALLTRPKLDIAPANQELFGGSVLHHVLKAGMPDGYGETLPVQKVQFLESILDMILGRSDLTRVANLPGRDMFGRDLHPPLLMAIHLRGRGEDIPAGLHLNRPLEEQRADVQVTDAGGGGGR
jgi:hypothetical protein